ncbi:MAG: ATP-dependent zinc metalloprotease FtsH, partial [Candidatus Sumerlaeia bacterium]|nr:ATP-dependent zinc metalloprotease FtsH [Candidatus Sumerlaeia bacterium]
MNNTKSIIIWVLIFAVCIAVAMQMMGRTAELKLTISEFKTIAELNKPEGEPTSGANRAFEGVVVDSGGEVSGTLRLDAVLPNSVVEKKNKIAQQLENKDTVKFRTSYTALNDLSDFSIANSFVYDSQQPSMFSAQYLMIFLVPLLLFVAFWIFFIRQVQSSGNKAMSFGRSKAKLISEGQIKIGFDDVAGVDEAKEELKEVVEFLKDPRKFSRLGGRIPKGVLLYGPPGTGKTLLAKAVAGEAKVPFFSISGSDFVEMFVGVGASRVRDLFDQAKRAKPCLVFVDEIDAVGRSRFAGFGGGHDEREQTLNQLLVEMDGFTTNEGVILIAATNRPDVLDPALLRPGRFDRQIAVDFPDVEGRLKILKVHAKTVKLAPEVDMLSVAKGTPGYSGADLANIINEAALLAARQNKTAIDQDDLEEAKDRVMMGPERRSMKISENEKRATAIHEGGHAIAARFTEFSDPVHKITIVPRGRSLGLTAYLPSEEKHSQNTREIKAKMVYALGGMAAEKIVLGDTGTGVGNDLKRVTNMARRMVCEFGMSDRLGPRTFGENQNDLTFNGRDGNSGRDFSEEMAQIIDEEVKLLVDEAYAKAIKILEEHR